MKFEQFENRDRPGIDEMTADDYDEDELIIRKKIEPVKTRKLSPAAFAKSVAHSLDKVRTKKPVVMCITNSVTENFVANALMALGATPIMINDMGEATEAAAKVDAILVNVGTVTKPQADVMRSAVAKANTIAKPWVLDPVATGYLSLRSYVSKELMRRYPSIIRANASEMLALVGEESTSRGVDTGVKSEDAMSEASRLSKITHATTIVSGVTDYVANEDGNSARCKNGHPMLTRISGTGCVQGAVAAAVLGVLGRANRFEAAAAAAVITGVAGELAAEKTTLPGSFQVAFIDALASMMPKEVEKRAKFV